MPQERPLLACLVFDLAPNLTSRNRTNTVIPLCFDMHKSFEKTGPVMGSNCGVNLDYRVFPVVDPAAYGWVAGIAPASILSTILSTVTS